MMDTPLVSVIVPVYNVKQYLDRCLSSIVNQTYCNLEIILVDDGSTDGSAQICDVFQKRDCRIKVIHKKNGGLVSARKAGIQAVSGDYVAYVDSDDWVEPEMYEELVKQVIRSGADLITSGLYRDYKDAAAEEFDGLPEGVYDSERIKKEILPAFMYTGVFFKPGINVHVFNKLFRRELVLNNQLMVDDVIRVGEDAALVYPCILDAKKIVIMRKCFYHYCVRQDSIMGTGYQEELSGYKSIYGVIKNKIISYDFQEELLMKQLNYLMVYMLLLKEPQAVIHVKDGFLIPFQNLRTKEKIILYGGGKFGNAIHSFLTEESLCEIVLWVDQSADSKRGIKDISKLKEMPKE